MALLTSYDILTASTSVTVGNANIQSSGELSGTSANISGNITLDGGLGSIGPSGDDLLINWNNENIVLHSNAGRVEVEADSDFVVNTNYDSGNALYSSRWVVTNNKIVNISNSAAIVSEAGDLTLSGGQDGVNSGNTTISAVNLGNAVYNWEFNNTGKLAIAGPSYANSPSNIYTSLNNGIALQPSWNQGGAGPTFLQGPGLDLHWNDGLFLTVSDGDYAQSEGNTSTVPFTISGPVTANGTIPVGQLTITGGTNGTANGDVNIGTSQTNVVRVKGVTVSNAADISTSGSLTVANGNVLFTGTGNSEFSWDNLGYLSITASDGLDIYTENNNTINVNSNGGITLEAANNDIQLNTLGGNDISLRVLNSFPGAAAGIDIQAGESTDDVGGSVNISAGTGVTIGGDVNVDGGASLGAANGGNVYISGGRPLETGSFGSVVIGSTRFGEITASSIVMSVPVSTRGTYEALSTINGATGVVVNDFSNGALFNYTNIAANFTVNVTNFGLSSNNATNMVLILNQGATAYVPTALQIGGVAQTINWQGGSQPAGNANKKDIVSFSMTNIGGSYLVLGQLVTFG